MSFSLFPRVIFRGKSKFNGEVVIKDFLWQRLLYADGVIQSGGVVEDIWKKALKRIQNTAMPAGRPAKLAGRQESRIENVLVLGLGGGTVIRLIRRYWPHASVTAVELDPLIIDLGKRFFSLTPKNNFKVINGDAIKFDPQHRKGFDLVLIDLYFGKKIPAGAEKDVFLRNIKSLLASDGRAIFNRIRFSKKNFEASLKEHFCYIEKVETVSNLFFIVGS